MEQQITYSAEQMLEDIFLYMSQLVDEKDFSKVVSLLTDLGRVLAHSERASFWYWDAKHKQYWTLAAVGSDKITIPEGSGIIDASIQNKETIVINDPYQDERFNPAVDKQTGFVTKSILCMPVTNAKGKVIGAYQAINKLNADGTAGTFDEKDKKIAVMCGMSGVFAALFGTPMAAAIFSMEVISIGVMYYAALVPCVFSAFTAAALARFWGLMPEQFAIGAVPAWSIETAIVAVGLAAGCALVSELFCIALHTTEHLYKKYLPSPVWRILSGAAIVIVLTLLTGSTRYNGSGFSLIEKCFEGEGLPWDFLIKILFTTVTLEAGFKGGEIVPTLTIGAAFGSFFAFLFGQPVGLMTACGMLGLFVGVTNCPISTLLLGFELFGYEAMPFFVLVIAVSFSFSGYYSLYASQKFIYSKTRTEFINRKTNK